ncbi:MAG: DNA topoisomerase I [Coriobacteriia bacterium]|nr:DNA topoisomerase I [Coriobacteriia bacterium]MCL2137083.1 DNA topoisomerase I [Coriobacteriia bacterium]
MRLVITEKNDAAKKIAELLSAGTVKADKVYDTPVYRFDYEGEDWVSIGLKGHILEVDFPEELTYTKSKGWYGTANGVSVTADIPKSLARPPFKKKKPFSEKAVDLKGWKMESLPYLVYAPVIKNPAEKGIIRSLKNLAGKADSVIIATDYDREGELIGWDALTMVLEAAPGLQATRARYSAFTKQEINSAFSSLGELDFDLASAGESRQAIDLIWGAVLTRYLTLAKYSGFGRVRPSGRVQTPTLAIIAAREELRNAFVPEDYWVLKARFNTPDGEFEATHNVEKFKNESEAKQAYANVEGQSLGRVGSIDKRRRQVKPPTPFNTTSLQAAAAAEGLSPARTMRLAESLYMAGFISYPRVDNTVYPASLDLKETLSILKRVPQYSAYANSLLANPQLKPTRGKTETTDHPPIYPTGAGSPNTLRQDEWKLYNLIARRFMATLSEAAIVEGTKLVIDVNSELFVARGDVLIEPGFRAVYQYGLKKDEQLPRLEEGQVIDFLGAELDQRQTEPPPRYSQGRLIQEMEKLGLGTKSTRASIIERLIEVRYIQNDPVEPTQLGMAVVAALGSFAPHITSPDMTANLEEEMSSIAAGSTTRDTVVNHSRALLAEIMEELIPRAAEVGEALSDAISADARIGACPDCGRDLQLKSSAKTRSSFIGCAGWPDCSVTFPVPSGRIEAVEDLCPVCGKPQIRVSVFRARPLILCIDPHCPTNIEPEIELGPCPVCAEEARAGVLKTQKNPRTLKRFIRCSNYEQCNTSYPLPQRGDLKAAGKVCDSCGTPKVIVQTARGPWELCPNTQCPLALEKAEAKASGSTATRRQSAGSSRATATSTSSPRKPASSTSSRTNNGTRSKTEGGLVPSQSNGKAPLPENKSLDQVPS